MPKVKMDLVTVFLVPRERWREMERDGKRREGESRREREATRRRGREK